MGMHRPQTPLDETLDARFLRAVEACCEHGNLSGRAFGIASIGDPGLVSSLRRGRSPRVSTVDRVLGYTQEFQLLSRRLSRRNGRNSQWCRNRLTTRTRERTGRPFG